jgi:pre-mRNA-processing factor 6
VGGDVRVARELLERAFVRTSESEQIWLAAVKLEAENGESGVARDWPCCRSNMANFIRIYGKSES